MSLENNDMADSPPELSAAFEDDLTHLGYEEPGEGDPGDGEDQGEGDSLDDEGGFDPLIDNGSDEGLNPQNDGTSA